jgi:hypothetical protein
MLKKLKFLGEILIGRQLRGSKGIFKLLISTNRLPRCSIYFNRSSGEVLVGRKSPQF